MRAEGGSTRRLTHIVATNRSAIPRKTPPDEPPPPDAAALPPKKWKKGKGGVAARTPDDVTLPCVAGDADGDDQAAAREPAAATNREAEAGGPER